MIDDDIRTALREHGFLAPEVQQFPAMYREMAQGWFDMTENFSRIGQRVAKREMTKEHVASDPRALGTALLMRTLQSYQAAIWLCSMGLATESRMLIRSCIENAFCIAALTTEPNKLIQALQDDDKAAKKGQAKFIAQEPARMGNLDKAARTNFQKFVSTIDQKWNKVRKLAIDEIAKSTPLADAYLLYRLLSNDSCHPSAASLSNHIVVLPSGQWDYQLGPSPAKKIEETLNFACHAIMSALVAFTELVGDNEGKVEVKAAVDAYSSANPATST